MHLQVRSETEHSPPDLGAVLALLGDEGLNIVSMGGSLLEGGGEFAFAVELASSSGEAGPRGGPVHAHRGSGQSAQPSGIGPDREPMRRALSALRRAGYRARIVGESPEPGYHDPVLGYVEAGLDFAYLPNQPRALWGFVRKVQGRNHRRRRLIQDIAVGLPDDSGNTAVQIYSRLIGGPPTVVDEDVDYPLHGGDGRPPGSRNQCQPPEDQAQA